MTQDSIPAPVDLTVEANRNARREVLAKMLLEVCLEDSKADYASDCEDAECDDWNAPDMVQDILQRAGQELVNVAANMLLFDGDNAPLYNIIMDQVSNLG